MHKYGVTSMGFHMKLGRNRTGFGPWTSEQGKKGGGVGRLMHIGYSVRGVLLIAE